MSQMKESKEVTFPKNFLQIVSQSEIQNATEGLIVLLHSCLLEVGFIPKDVETDPFSCMPNEWKSNGVFKIQYFHPIVPHVFIWITWVPLFDNLLIQGTVEIEASENTVHVTVPHKKYTTTHGDFLDYQNLFCNTDELSRLFKDGFCYPLLAALEECANCKPSFGFSGLIDELKFLIMKKLPVEDVVTLSSVNSDFYRKANSKYLWQHLYSRDFCPNPVLNSTVDIDWKELYKVEYLKRRSRHRFRPLPMHHPSPYPQIYPGAPHVDVDPSLFQYMDPIIQETFPQLRPSNWLFPGRQYQYLGRFW